MFYFINYALFSEILITHKITSWEQRCLLKCFIVVTKFWKINHFVVHKTITIFKLSMALPQAENAFKVFLGFFL